MLARETDLIPLRSPEVESNWLCRVSQTRVVAITGASSGIGAATALLLARRFRSARRSRRAARPEEIAGQIHQHGGRATICRVDVTRPEDLERLVAQALDQFD